jgi:hypothetical protein
LTWTRCDCDCGFEGEDDVTQFCIEDAVMERLHRLQQAATDGEAPVLSPHEQAKAEHQALLDRLRPEG